MKKYWALLITSVLPLITFAQEAEKSLDEKINDFFATATGTDS